MLGLHVPVRLAEWQRGRAELRDQPPRRGRPLRHRDQAVRHREHAGRSRHDAALGADGAHYAMIPFLDLTRQHAELERELAAAVTGVLRRSQFILGPEGRALEGELATLCGVRHGIGVASGTDALHLALAAVGAGPGDEVITPAFSFVASASTSLMRGAQPVFADIDPDTYAVDPEAVERAITPRTRAIIVVHLYGQPGPMDRLSRLARARGIALIEDAAQAIGATWDGRPIGSWGDATCLSFYPTKNLGACGDAGRLLTNRDDVAQHVRRLRHHGDTGAYHPVETGYWTT